jgi:peptide/nickel transport system substrate-binding protein
MKNLKKTFALVLVLTMLTTVGCGNVNEPAAQSNETVPNSGETATSTTPNEASSEQIFTYACGTEPSTLDPHMANSTIDGQMCLQISEPLVMRDANSKIIPLLAESWESNEDGSVWKFKLRQDVKFQDGEPFNAEAVKYNFDRIASPDTMSPKASIVRMIESTNVVDEYTVEFILNTPCSVFLAQVSSYTCSMLSPKACEETGAKTGQNPVGTGPLKLKEWNYGSSITFERNDDYWGTPATTKEVTVKFVPEDTSRVMMLMTGDTDVIANVPMIQIDELEADPNVEILFEKGYRTIFIGMNSGKVPELADVRVRKAINNAIDKESIINNLLRGIATYPDSGMVSNVIDNSSVGLGSYEYDVEKAKQLMAEAGYSNGFSITLDTPEGRYAMDRQIAEVIQAMLAEIGITVSIDILDWGAYQERSTNGTHELFLLGMGCPTGDPEYNLYQNFGRGSQNASLYVNNLVDQLLEDQASIVDSAERYEVMYKLQKELMDDACAAPLYYEMQSYGYRSDVDGFIVYPNEIINLAYLVRN